MKKMISFTGKEAVEMLFGNGETPENLANQMNELTTNVRTMVENIKSLCGEVNPMLIAVSGFSIVCQVNCPDGPLSTLVIGNREAVEKALDCLTNEIKE